MVERAESCACHVVIRARGNVNITSVTSIVTRYAKDGDVTCHARKSCRAITYVAV